MGGITKRYPRSGPAHLKAWTTKDGRKIRVCHMDDDHLVNTIKYIKRFCDNKYYQELRYLNRHLDSVSGEAACDCLESEIRCLENVGPDYPDILYDMEEELIQRGLEDLLEESNE